MALRIVKSSYSKINFNFNSDCVYLKCKSICLPIVQFKRQFSLHYLLCNHLTKSVSAHCIINKKFYSEKSSILPEQDIIEDSITTLSKKISNKPKLVGRNGPGLDQFIANIVKRSTARQLKNVSHPYIQPKDISGNGKSVYFEVHGCQMNVSDTEIAWSILSSYGYTKASEASKANIILVMTCAIREGAEDKIWNKLTHLKYYKSPKHNIKNVKIGVLGCMAERLKDDLMEKEKSVDIVAGPDSYKDLPRLLAIVESGDKSLNVLLSHDETYADIRPVSLSSNKLSAFVSIMRGCDNMCSYCIVPFTRGKERSRDVESIVDEVKCLSDNGVKEITLLGQNVNSYRDLSLDQTNQHCNDLENNRSLIAKGFTTVYKIKMGGRRFDDLLDQVSAINPEIRIRFTSPHPKDFPDDVLHLINERPNICKNLHLPAQSGNSEILALMRRGYTRESYLSLVDNIKTIIPSISLSSDFICGFCSETEEQFEETMSLLEQVQYNFCYIFPYSMREKTGAHRKLEDNVPKAIKLSRAATLMKLFRNIASDLNRKQIGKRHLILVEGLSKRSPLHLVGRCDSNIKVIIPNLTVEVEGEETHKSVQPGDYVEVLITDATSQCMQGIPLQITTLSKFSKRQVPNHNHSIASSI